MRPTVIRIEPNRMDELRQWFSTMHATEVRKTSEYEIFRFTYSGETIIGYTSGKLVIYGEQASSLVREGVQKLFADEDEYNLTIGSDEAGKGEWLGPLAVAAVGLTPDQSSYLQAYGVMDSKELNYPRTKKLSELIKERSTAFRILVMNPETFNKRFEEFHTEGKNLNDMLAWAHSKVISEVYQQLKPDEKNLVLKVIIDEFARVKTEERLGRILDLATIELIQIHGAEIEIPVASASILARNAREEWIDKACEKHSLNLRKLSAREIKKMAIKNLIAKVSYLP